MEFKDYYAILGVAKNASQDEIQRAYRKLARQYHPDINKESEAENKFKEIGEAYEVLKDPEKRAAYDELGANWKAGEEFRPPPDWGTGFEFSGRGFDAGDAAAFSEFFEQLFGARTGRAYADGAAGIDAHGQDHHAIGNWPNATIPQVGPTTYYARSMVDSFRNFLISRSGGAPNWRLYSRLNCEGLS